MTARPPLLPHQMAEINAIKVAWMRVGSEFANRGEHRICEECHHCQLRGDVHPFGESVAVDVYDECDLGESPSDKPTDCPAYVEAVQEEAREAAWQAQGEKEMNQEVAQ